jgi:O-antigen ligase
MTTVAIRPIDQAGRQSRYPTREQIVARWGWFICLSTLGAWATSAVLPFTFALAMSSVVAASAAVLGLRYPVLGLLGIGILCALDSILGPLLLQGGFLRWSTINYWLVGVAFLFAPLLVRERGLPALFLALLVAWLGIGLLLTPDLMAGLTQMSALVVVLGLVVYFRRATRVPEVWFWMALAVALASALGTLAFLSAYPPAHRINPNIWSDLPLAGVHAACIGLALEGSRRRRFVLGLLFAVNLAWVFLSASRGALLIAAVALVAVVAMAETAKRRVVLLGAGGLVAVGLVLQFPALAHRSMERLALTFDQSRSIKVRSSARSEIARGGWELFRMHPILGVGTGGFARERAALGRVGTRFYRPGTARSAHSGWVRVIAENGLPGALLLAGFVASFAWVGRRLADRRLRLLAYAASATLCLGLIATEFSSKELWFFAAGSMVLVTSPGLHRRPSP